VNQKIVGPALTDVAKKHNGNVDYIAGKIRAGGSGVWGPIPMPAQTLSEADARIIANWIAAGAAR
jgi:cytochrome c